MSKQTFTTIDSPEFINLQPLDINPLMSKCEIKVFYLGENRNGSFINKETATDMAKTLRGAPIVGYFKEEKQDFADHGEVMTIDDEGIHFECRTRPYGFVAPDAKVWFQKFAETNEFGEETEREYLMTTGFLWTGQYEEAKQAVEGEGKPQSMELDEDSLNGHWATNQAGMDFYIITDATFSKLCILGDDVEPCFEGARVATPEISKTFTKVDDDFKRTLFSMMQELQFALEGGTQMEDSTKKKKKTSDAGTEAPVIEEAPVDTPAEPTPTGTESQPTGTESTDTEPTGTEPATVEPTGTEPTGTEPTGGATDPEVTDPVENPVDPNANAGDSGNSNPADGEGGDGDGAGNGTGAEAYAFLQNQFNALLKDKDAIEQSLADLKTQYAALQEQNEALIAFKKGVEDEKKDEMIKSFYMLSDEEKREVIENKDKFSLEEIEAKLSVICVRKKVNFDSDDSNKNHNNTEGQKNPMTFNLDSIVSDTPAWLQAVLDTKNSTNN